MAKRVGGFFTKMGGEGGPKCKTATHPLPPIAEQGRWRWASAAADSGSLGDGGDRGEKGKGEEREEIRSPYLTRAMVE